MSMIRTRNQSALGITFLDGRYLELDASNDPVTAGLEVNAATAAEAVLTLQSTDDNPANAILELQDSGGATLLHIHGNSDLILLQQVFS